MTENIIPDWAVPGAEVVCIQFNAFDLLIAGKFGVVRLMEKQHYVIRAAVARVDGAGLLLVGIDNTAISRRIGDNPDLEIAYTIDRFRPVKKLKEDVALFESLLQPSDERLGVLLDDLNTAWLEAEQTSFAFDDWREKFRSP